MEKNKNNRKKTSNIHRASIYVMCAKLYQYKMKEKN